MGDSLRERCSAWVDAVLPLHQDRHALIKRLVDFVQIQVVAFSVQAQASDVDTGKMPVAKVVGENAMGDIQIKVCNYDKAAQAPQLPLNNRVEITIGGHTFIPRDHRDWMYESEAEQFAEQLRGKLGLRP